MLSSFLFWSLNLIRVHWKAFTKPFQNETCGGTLLDVHKKIIPCTCMKNRRLCVLRLTCSGNEVYKCTNCSDQARAHFRLLRETHMRYRLVDCHPAEVKKEKEKVNPYHSFWNSRLKGIMQTGAHRYLLIWKLLMLTCSMATVDITPTLQDWQSTN